MMKYILFCLCIVAALSCKETPPEPPKPPTLTLKAEDASCTEAWLKVTTTERPATVRLLRDGQHVSVLGLRSSDSLVVTEGLLPKHTYAFQLQKLAADSSVLETSTGVQVTTMDTTSHDFTWQIDTLGVTSSVLYDVAIVSDNDVWAVGEIFLNDSSGQLDPVHYNAAHWDGTRWNIMRLFSDCRLYWPNCGPVYFTTSPGKAIFAFAANDIWIVAGGVHHFDGIRWTEQRAIVEVGATNKIWGSNSNDMWLVGNNGIIIHKSGTTWQRVESGTSADIQDIWGSAITNYALAAVSNVAALGDLKILRVSSSQQVEQIPWSTGRRVHSVWFSDDKKIFASGGGVFVRYADLRWREQTSVPLIYTRRVRGVTPQDVFVAGDFGLVAHFNGMSWRVFPEVAAALYYSCDYRQNRMIAVGERSGRAVVLRMWR